LEMDGVLKSWAVPKGPSMHAEEKRLAVHVEDHPVEYADFEGVIAHGNYGAGSVIVWDRGWYRLVKPEDPLDQLRRGKLEFELFGYKLRGRWTPARMSGKDKDWLFEIKFDGVRVLAVRRGTQVELYGRSGQVITGRYPDLVRTLLALRVDHFVIDGEIVALDSTGRPSFQRLQPRMALTDPRE